MKLTEFEEAFIRVTQLLDEPDLKASRKAINQHLDTMIEYAADDDQKRTAYNFKAMALAHIDSIGVDSAENTEVKRVRGLQACAEVEKSIQERHCRG